MAKLTLLLLLGLPLIAWAQSEIYRTVDENGNVIFSDTPPADGSEAQTVDIRPTNSAPPLAAPALLPQEDEAPEEPVAEERTVQIIAPANETTIPMGPGNFNVSAEVQPPLADTEGLQLLLNDEPWGDPQASSMWALTNVFRGENTLTVLIVDANGETVAASDPVTVFVFRPTVN